MSRTQRALEIAASYRSHSIVLGVLRNATPVDALVLKGRLVWIENEFGGETQAGEVFSVSVEGDGVCVAAALWSNVDTSGLHWSLETWSTYPGKIGLVLLAASTRRLYQVREFFSLDV